MHSDVRGLRLAELVSRKPGGCDDHLSRRFVSITPAHRRGCRRRELFIDSALSTGDPVDGALPEFPRIGRKERKGTTDFRRTADFSQARFPWI